MTLDDIEKLCDAEDKAPPFIAHICMLVGMLMVYVGMPLLAAYGLVTWLRGGDVKSQKLHVVMKVTTSCCGHYYVAVAPQIRFAELECPKCGAMQAPAKIVYDSTGDEAES